MCSGVTRRGGADPHGDTLQGVTPKEEIVSEFKKNSGHVRPER